MNENKEQETTDNSTITPVTEELSPVNNTDLSIDELISKIELLAENINPYTVSKEIEELKSIFYLKLKAETKIEKEDTAP